MGPLGDIEVVFRQKSTGEDIVAYPLTMLQFENHVQHMHDWVEDDNRFRKEEFDVLVGKTITLQIGRRN